VEKDLGLESILVAAEGLKIGEDMEDAEDGDLTIAVNPSGEASTQDVKCSADQSALEQQRSFLEPWSKCPPM